MGSLADTIAANRLAGKQVFNDVNNVPQTDISRHTPDVKHLTLESNAKAKSRKRKNRRRGSSIKLCSDRQKEDQPEKNSTMIHQRDTVTNEMNSGTRKAHGDFKIQNQRPEYGFNTDRARYENKMSDSASNADSGFNTSPCSSLSSVYPSYGFPEVELPDDYVSSEEWMQLRIRKRFQRKKTKKESLASMLKEVKRIAEEHHEYTKTMENNIAYEKEQSGHVIENNAHGDKETRDDPAVKGIIVKEYPTNDDLGNDVSKQHISEINGALNLLSQERDEHAEVDRNESNETIKTDRTVDGQTIEDTKQQTNSNGVVTESPKEYVLHSDNGGNNVKDNDRLSVLTAKTPSPSNGQVSESKTSSPSAKTGIKRDDYLDDVREKNASGNIGEKEILPNDKHEGSIFELTMTDTNLVSNSPSHHHPPSGNAPYSQKKGLQGDVKIHKLQQPKRMSQEKEKERRENKKSKEASANSNNDDKGNKTTNDKKDDTKVSSSSHAIYGGLDNGEYKKSIPLRKETIKEHDTTKGNRSQNVAEKNKGKSKAPANVTQGIKDSNGMIIQKASTPKKGNDIKESPNHSKNNTRTSSNSSSLSVAARTALMMAKMKQTHLDAVKNHNGFLDHLSETRLGIQELYSEMVENRNDANFEKKDEHETIAGIQVSPEQEESDDILKAEESLEKTTHVEKEKRLINTDPNRELLKRIRKGARKRLDNHWAPNDPIIEEMKRGSNINSKIPDTRNVTRELKRLKQRSPFSPTSSSAKVYVREAERIVRNKKQREDTHSKRVVSASSVGTYGNKHSTRTGTKVGYTKPHFRSASNHGFRSKRGRENTSLSAAVEIVDSRKKFYSNDAVRTASVTFQSWSLI